MITLGDITQAKITGIKDYGAFVSLPEGKTGMVHISQVSSDYVENIHQHLIKGQEVKVKVIAIDDKGKISLSMKQTEEKPKYKKKISQSNIWQDENKTNQDDLDFEQMLSKFKKSSDEKISALKKSTGFKNGVYSKKSK